METKSDSTSPSRSVPDPASASTEASDGGLDAWLKVVGCFFLFFNAWGFVGAFGAFQAYYEASLLSHTPASTISWIGTIEGFLLLLLGIIAGPLYDLGYIRWLILTGSFLVVFGMMMLSLATQYYQVLLSHGICVGIGSGALWMPGVALLSSKFSKKRPLALGIASAGSAVGKYSYSPADRLSSRTMGLNFIGGIIYPIVFRRLQPEIGFAWTTRVLGFIAFGTFLIALVLVLPSSYKNDIPRSILEIHAFKEVPFVFFTLALFFLFLGYWVPFFYMTSFARSSLHDSPDYAFYLLSISNAASIFGRIFPAFIAQRFGSIQTLTASAICCGALGLAWLGIHDVAGFTVFAVLYGFFTGVLVALPMAVVPSISPSMSVVGTRNGMSWSLASIGVLVGSPIAGALSNPGSSIYTGAQSWTGGVMVLGSVLLAVPWYYITQGKGDTNRITVNR